MTFTSVVESAFYQGGYMALPLQIETVRPYLNGQWLQVWRHWCQNLMPLLLEKAVAACPVHGGRWLFRLFKDAEYTGGGVW